MCDYKLKMQYVLNSRSYSNRQTVKSYQEIFHTIINIRIFIVNISLKFSVNKFPLHERILLYFSCPRPYNVSNGPPPSFVPNSQNTSPRLSFLALIKTFSECRSKLIVMIYDIFASQKHIFAIYARTKEHFMGLLRAFLVINYC